MLTVTLQFNIIDTLVTLPKITVTIPPVGSPIQTPHPVEIHIPGILPGDIVTTTNFLNGSGVVISSGFITGDTSIDYLTVQNSSTLNNIVVASGYVIIEREVQSFNVYSSTTDIDGLVTIEHKLYYTPTKYLATVLIGSSQEHITLCFISSDDTYASFQAFVNGLPYSNSAITFSAQLM